MTEFITSAPWWAWAGLYIYVQVAIGLFMHLYELKQGVSKRVCGAFFTSIWPAYLPALIIAAWLKE